MGPAQKNNLDGKLADAAATRDLIKFGPCENRFLLEPGPYVCDIAKSIASGETNLLSIASIFSMGEYSYASGNQLGSSISNQVFRVSASFSSEVIIQDFLPSHLEIRDEPKRNRAKYRRGEAAGFTLRMQFVPTHKIE